LSKNNELPIYIRLLCGCVLWAWLPSEDGGEVEEEEMW